MGRSQRTLRLSWMTRLSWVWSPYRHSCKLIGGAHGLGAFRKMDGRVGRIHVANPVVAKLAVRVVASKSDMNSETVEFIRQLGAHELLQAGSSLSFVAWRRGFRWLSASLAYGDTAAGQVIVEVATSELLSTEKQWVSMHGQSS